MTILNEIKAFIQSIFYWICCLVGITGLLFAFGLDRVSIYGIQLIMLLPSEKSISVMFFDRIKEDLLPAGVQLITTNPISAFLAQVTLSLLLAFLVTSPLLFYQFVSYLHPALKPHEQKAVLWSLLPFCLLFFLGALFSYIFLIPATFEVLYPYATVMEIVPYFAIDEFTQYVFGLTVGVGLMFLLPLFMILLSFMGIISPEFWRSKWRIACVFFLVLSAIITPDGTGITMAMLFIPLVVLYFLGYYFAKRYGKAPESDAKVGL